MQLAFDTEWTQDRIEENKAVNRIRQRVGVSRGGSTVHAVRQRIPTRSASEGSFVHAVRQRTPADAQARDFFASVATGDKR